MLDDKCAGVLGFMAGSDASEWRGGDKGRGIDEGCLTLAVGWLVWVMLPNRLPIDLGLQSELRFCTVAGCSRGTTTDSGRAMAQRAV